MGDTTSRKFNTRRVILLTLALFGCLSLKAANFVVLAWNPSAGPAVAGYTVYYGTDGTNFDTELDTGLSTSATVSNLQAGVTYYFEVAAYNAQGEESPPSTPVAYSVPALPAILTAAADSTNAGSVTGGGTFNSGSSVTVTAAANAGYYFANWTSNGIVQSTSATYAFTLVSNCALVANFATNPIVSVAASPANGGVVTGGASYSLGTSVTVSAAPNSGYTFANWTLNGVVQSASASYTFAVTGSSTLIANFTANPTVTVAASPANAGSATGGGSFVAGSTVTVKATANSGYTFSNWTANGIVQSASPNYSFAITSNSALVANFTANPIVTVAANPASAGSVTGGGSFVTGSSVSVTAAANSGYTFANWTQNGIVQSAAANYSFTVTANSALVANFTAKPTVSVTASPANAGTVTGGGAFATGASVTVTAAAGSGYTFANWTANGILQSVSPGYTFVLASNLVLVANFTTNATLTVTPSSSNGGSVTGGGTYAAGASVTVTAAANSGYTFANWTASGIVQATSPTYSFNIVSNLALVANFTTNITTYTVTGGAATHGSISPSGPQTVISGSNITFTAAPAGGYQVSQWLVNGTVARNSGLAYTLAGVISNETVTVNFSAIPATTTNTPAPTPDPDNTVVNTNFSLVIVGSGRLTPYHAGEVFEEGKKFTLTAVAANDSVFAGWISNGVTVATTARYTFVALSNVMLQATFIPNPFIPVMGTYNGLFYDTNGVAPESSGSFVASVSGSGAYTARIRLGVAGYSFSGKFSLAGFAVKTIVRPGLSPLTIQLQLGAAHEPMSGTVSDGIWTAELVADPAVYSSANPTSLAGKYTLVIPGSTNSSGQPGGNGIGTVTVNASGHINFNGVLGDGTAVSVSSVVSAQGDWPFYIPLYAGKGSIVGWLSFTNDGIAGPIAWFKMPEATAKLYSNGFTNNTGVTGSVYHDAGGATPISLSSGLLTVSGGDLTQDISDSIAFGQDAVGANQSGPKVTFQASNGRFQGSVENSETGKRISFEGVVLQNQNLGAGVFVGPTGTGSVLLSSAE